MKLIRPKKKLTRREFLRTAAGATGALIAIGAMSAGTARARKKATRKKAKPHKK